MKTIRFLLVAILSVTFGFCSGSVDNTVLLGYWGNTINDATGTQKFVAYFYDNNKNIQCEFHSYQNGMKFGSEQAADICFEGKSISMVANESADVKYEGEVDIPQNVIRGKLIYHDGSEMEFNLTKYSRDKIQKEFPGLLHLKETEYSYSKPENLHDGLPASSLKEMKINENLLTKMVNEITNGEYAKVNSMLILRKGKLVFEKYFDGFYTTDLHVLMSATKSISSILIGIAVDKGLIKSINQKLLNFYPEYRNKVDHTWNDVTLQHILTMTSGLDISGSNYENYWTRKDDIIKSTFEQKFKSLPGEKFAYLSPPVDLLAGVLIQATGESVQKFAEKNLFKPLRITSYKWQNFKKNNYPLMDGSLCLKPRDMAKIGQMILDEGKWNNKQIVSRKWIEESTSPKINVDKIFDYGYLWWHGKSQSKPGLNAVIATGLGGQHIIVVPDLSLVIVTTGSNFDKSPGFLLRMIDEYIIKSVN